MASIDLGKYASLLDRVEQAGALFLYVWFLFRIWPEDTSGQELVPAMMLVAEGMMVVFLLIRKPSANISVRVQDWVVAVAGTMMPLLAVTEGTAVSLLVSGVLMMVGFFTQLAAKMSLNRSFGLVAANRGVKTKGAYHFVRHPMYLGYMITHTGFLFAVPRIENVVIYGIVWSLLVVRIFMEERVLSESEDYRAFQKEQPWRLLPGIF